jgi:hypothetical protein
MKLALINNLSRLTDLKIAGSSCIKTSGLCLISNKSLDNNITELGAFEIAEALAAPSAPCKNLTKLNLKGLPPPPPFNP